MKQEAIAVCDYCNNKTICIRTWAMNEDEGKRACHNCVNQCFKELGE